MPVILGPSRNRRDFLRMLGVTSGAVMLGGCARLPFGRGKAPAVTRWALLADTHVSLNAKEMQRGRCIDDNFKLVVDQLVKAAPEYVAIAGDLARLEGKEGDYRMFRDLVEPLASRFPVAVCFGNHDHRENFRKTLTLKAGEDPKVKGRRVRVVDQAGLRFILLDSLLSERVTGGLLGKEQRAWLEKFLDQSDRRPTFLFLHHDLRDQDSALLDADRFSKIILPRKQVKAVFYGHTHAYRYEQVKGMHVINIPAVGYNFSDKEPLGWIEARFLSDGGEFTLHAFAGSMTNSGKTTSLAWR